MVRTAFNRVQHGFKFANSFVNHVISVPEFRIDVTTRGRCGGMAFAALDYWHHRLAIPEESSLPAEGTLLSTYIWDRLLNSMTANASMYFHFMRTPDHPTVINGIGVARATREQEFPKLRQLIDQGQPCALGLTQARNVGEFGNDHQVVAYGYEIGDPYSRVLVYDNNYPNDEIFLEFSTAYNPGDREIRHSIGSVWRGFFVETYASQVPPFLSNGSLLSEVSRPEIYLLQGGGRFWIPSPAEFDANGFVWDAVRKTADGSMRHVSTYPANGTLIRERNADAVYVVYGGVPFHIPSPAVFDALGFQWESIFTIPGGSMGELRTFPADGTLLREISQPAVYLAQDRNLKHVPNEQVFIARGFSWANVGVVPDGGLGPIAKGEPLSTTIPDPPTIPRSWAERQSGSIHDADGDVIDYTIEQNVVTDEVRFVLELGNGVTWKKELVLIAHDGRWTIPAPSRLDNYNGLDRNQLPNGKLLFRKAKAIGIMTDVHALGNLDQLPIGARVTFVWEKD